MYDDRQLHLFGTATSAGGGRVADDQRRGTSTQGDRQAVRRLGAQPWSMCGFDMLTLTDLADLLRPEFQALALRDPAAIAQRFR